MTADKRRYVSSRVTGHWPLTTAFSVPRVLLLAALLLFSQTYLGQEWLAALILLASFAALMVFLAAVIGLALFGCTATARPARREEER